MHNGHFITPKILMLDNLLFELKKHVYASPDSWKECVRSVQANPQCWATVSSACTWARPENNHPYKFN